MLRKLALLTCSFVATSSLLHQMATAGILLGGQLDDEQTSVGYVAATGEVFVAAPISTELTSIRIASANAILTGDPADNLTLPPAGFDIDEDAVIFKSLIGDSFGSLSFGNVAQPGLSHAFLLTDFDVTGSLAGGGGLGDVDLIFSIPEPTTLSLGLPLLGIVTCFRKWNMFPTG